MKLVKKPRLSTIIKHFELATEVRCVVNNISVGIHDAKNFEWVDDCWKVKGSIITLWKDNKFADIVTAKKKKPCGCKNCKCNETKNT